MLSLCHRGTKTGNQFLPLYFSRSVDHSTLHLSLVPLHAYDSISILAVRSWSTLFIATRSTNSCRREELRFPMDHVSSSKKSIQQSIMLCCQKQILVNRQMLGVSHWKIILLFFHLFIYIQVDPKRLENPLDIEKVKWIKCTYKYNYNYKRITMNALLQFI
jgi:hypothetical protein